MRVKRIERFHGWLSGENSEDLNPVDGCGAK
jgi:hypothetical protein